MIFCISAMSLKVTIFLDESLKFYPYLGSYIFSVCHVYLVSVYTLWIMHQSKIIKIISFSPCLVVPSGDHAMLYFLICNCCQNCKMLVWMLVQMMTSGKNELMVTLCAFSDIEGQAYSHN